jgi:hypothetical protein
MPERVVPDFPAPPAPMIITPLPSAPSVPEWTMRQPIDW